MSEIKKYIEKIVSGNSLNEYESARCAQIITLGGATPAQISAYFTSIATKNPSASEILGTVDFINSKIGQISFNERICSVKSLGSSREILNITLPSSLIISSFGHYIIDMGDFSQSSNSTAGLLSSLGVILNDKVDYVKLLADVGYCFFEQKKLIKNITDINIIRYEIGIKSIFDLSMPFIAKFKANDYVVGVTDYKLIDSYIDFSIKYNIERTILIYNKQSIDKIYLNGKNHIYEITDGTVAEYILEAKDFDLPEINSLDNIINKSSNENNYLLLQLLGNFHNIDYANSIIAHSSLLLCILDSDYDLISAKNAIIEQLKSKRVFEKLIKLVEFNNLPISLEV